MTDARFLRSYTSPRPDIEALVPDGVHTVLDVGCSTGVLGAAIKDRTGAKVIGIELDAEMAATAASRLDQVHVGDAAALLMGDTFRDQRFDVIVFADVLEHLVDPWEVLRRAGELLTDGGCVVTSLPNVRHVSTLFHLAVLGHWPYRDRGIHDRTHLRFFTLRNVRELFQQAGFRIERMNTNYRLRERPKRINRIAKWFAFPGIRGFLAYQYLVRAVCMGSQDRRS